MNKQVGDHSESQQEVTQENFRWAQEQVQLLMINKRYKDAVKLLLRIIDHVSIDGKINSTNDKLLVAIRLSECYVYIHENSKTFSQLFSLLDQLTNQVYSNTDVYIELKHYILYRQHVASFYLNPNTNDRKRNSTFMYVMFSNCI